MFNEIVRQLIASFTSPDPIATFNPFLLVSYADLKKYTYHYWFAFPALIQKPAWELVIDEERHGDGEATSLRDWNGDVSQTQSQLPYATYVRLSSCLQVDALRTMKRDAQITAEAFLYRSSANPEQISSGSVAPVSRWWTFFEDVPEEEVCEPGLGLGEGEPDKLYVAHLGVPRYDIGSRLAWMAAEKCTLLPCASSAVSKGIRCAEGHVTDSRRFALWLWRIEYDYQQDLQSQITRCGWDLRCGNICRWRERSRRGRMGKKLSGEIGEPRS